MVNLRDRLNGAPLVVVALVEAILFGGFSLLVNIATGLARLNSAAVIGAAASGLIFGIFMSVFIRFQRSRSGGAVMARSVTNAIKSGKLPETATAEEWGPLLDRRRRQARLYRWVGPVEFGLFALLGVYLLFSDPTRALLWGFEILLFVAAVAAYPIWANRQVSKIDALRNQLSQQTPAST
ncbi:MAG: hypothetical protein QOD39_1117 [Mycobacterium sp.]|nr:hypothetical protein [Mycobacterium sp.]